MIVIIAKGLIFQYDKSIGKNLKKINHEVALNILPIDIKEVKNDTDMAEVVEIKLEIKQISLNTIQIGWHENGMTFSNSNKYLLY